MKEMTTASKNTPTRWQETNWHRATTLRERVASLPTHSDETSMAAFLPTDERAKQRLQLWKDQAALKKGTLFAQRLAVDGLTEADLLTLLAEPMEALQARLATSPDWLITLARAFDQQEATENFTLPLQNMQKGSNTPTFLNILAPLLKDGCVRLQAGIQELTRHYPRLPFDSNTILPLLFAHVPAQILPKFSRTFVLELNVARIQGRLQGETPEERFLSFCQHLSQPEGLLPLLEEYPVLARQFVEIIDRWVSCDIEFVHRLCADWEQICETFTPAHDPGVLIEILGGAGDTHRSGHSVKLLRWSSDFQLVYKPRDMSIDLHFQELLMWLNAHGQQPPFRTFEILNRGDYGWTEFVSTQACISPEGVERFYQRQGAYLALLYTLQGTDFHYENVIASGEHPMLVDLETLFHPRVYADDILDPGSETIGQSVLFVGLLPQNSKSNEHAGSVETSGLGSQKEQLTPQPVPQWKGMGTDQMRLTQEHTEISPGRNHRPTLNEQDVDTSAYSDHIIDGFAATYRRLIDYRRELLTEVLPRFAQDQIRCVLRPSQNYALLLNESFHPNALRDALDRDRLFDHLWLNVEHQSYLSKLIPAEQCDLLSGDIPLFSSSPSSRDLVTSRGETIPAFFREPSLESVKKRLQQLDERDMKKQLWMIRASFTCMMLDPDKPNRRRLDLHPSHTKVTYQQLVAQARAVGDHLDELALHHDNAVGWLGIAPANEDEWKLLPAGIDLYDGTSGIALFLAYLGLLTGEDRYTTLAQSALINIRAQVGQAKKRSQFGGISTFGGIGAVIYLLSHLGKVWHDPSLYREAEQIVPWLPDLIERDELFDFIGGSASCLAALLSLYHVAPSPQTLATALQCGDRLIAAAQPMKTGLGWPNKQQEIPLTGLAHGNAGIALNLLRLYAVSQQDRFRHTACAALDYERSLFSTEQHNWPDLRELQGLLRLKRANTTSTEEGAAYMVAWCHGAPGIGLTRLASRQYIDDAAIETEIDAAIRTTLTKGFGMNHSLCHGDMGNLELLHMAATQDRLSPEQNEQLEQLTAMLLDSIQTHGWVSGASEGVETPGLMLGLAGTGYALLRLAAPERVPSVLVLAPPC